MKPTWHFFALGLAAGVLGVAKWAEVDGLEIVFSGTRLNGRLVAGLMAGISIPPPDSATVARFDDLVPRSQDVTVRKMFGQPSAFARGRLFFGVFGASLFVRLPETERATLLRLPGAKPFEPMRGRVMTEYVVLPSSVLASPRGAANWISKSLKYALSLPAKSKSREKRRSGRSRAVPVR